MISAILLSCGLLASGPEVVPAPSAVDREAYLEAKARVGRDADSQVRLALWCEARGLQVERLGHLASAVLADPGHAPARALMGFVSEGGRWARPEVIADRLKADPAASALRAEYEARRLKAGDTADDQWALARWAEEHGLKAEALAHDTAVTRIDPRREAAWLKLGCKNYRGKWMTPEQAEALRLDREAGAKAERTWSRRLQEWRVELGDPRKKAKAEAALLAVVDPRAVPSIVRVFAHNGPKEQIRAVRLLGQVDSVESSQVLARLAVFGDSEEVRRSSIETLRLRDLRGALDLVIRLIRDPIRYQAKLNAGPDAPAVLTIEGKDRNLARVYPANLWQVPAAERAGQVREIVDRATEAANNRLAQDIAWIDDKNASAEGRNTMALLALHGITGKDFGPDRDAWMAWWTDRQGYAYKSSDQSTGPRGTTWQVVDTYPSRWSATPASPPALRSRPWEAPGRSRP